MFPCRNLDAHRVIDGGGHLACRETLPDQGIELPLLLGKKWLHRFRRKLDARGPDRLMGILRLLARAVDIRFLRHKARPVVHRQEIARLFLRQLRNAGGIRAHIGDETDRAAFPKLQAFIELLREHHGPAAGKAELPRGVLLHAACREGCGRLPAPLALLDLLDGERGLLQLPHQIHALPFIVQRQLFPVHMGELRIEHRRLALPELEADGPVFLGAECLDLLLPVADQLHRHRLHPPGGKPFPHFAPEQRAQLIAHDTVQHAARLLGIHTVHANGPGFLYRLLDGRFRNLVKYDAAVALRVDIQNMRQMPRDRLSLAAR